MTPGGVLRARGYQTPAFVGSVFLERQLGLDQGFDYYDSPFQFEAFSKLSGEVLFVKSQRNRFAVRDRRGGYPVIHAAQRWLNKRRDRPVFAFVGLIDRAPAILEFLHIPIPPSFAGASLLQQNPRPVYSESFHARDAFGWAPQTGALLRSLGYLSPGPRSELTGEAPDPKDRLAELHLYEKAEAG